MELVVFLSVVPDLVHELIDFEIILAVVLPHQLVALHALDLLQIDIFISDLLVLQPHLFVLQSDLHHRINLRADSFVILQLGNLLLVLLDGLLLLGNLVIELLDYSFHLLKLHFLAFVLDLLDAQLLHLGHHFLLLLFLNLAGSFFFKPSVGVGDVESILFLVGLFVLLLVLCEYQLLYLLLLVLNHLFQALDLSQVLL